MLDLELVEEKLKMINDELFAINDLLIEMGLSDKVYITDEEIKRQTRVLMMNSRHMITMVNMR